MGEVYLKKGKIAKKRSSRPSAMDGFSMEPLKAGIEGPIRITAGVPTRPAIPPSAIKVVGFS
ncbi:MAG: hypothetical protein V3R94_08990 [Acidobacteriota bacterium]